MLPLGWDEFEALRVVEGLQFVIGKWGRRQAVHCGSDAHLGGDGARASTSQTVQTATLLARLSHLAVPTDEAPSAEGPRPVAAGGLPLETPARSRSRLAAAVPALKPAKSDRQGVWVG